MKKVNLGHSDVKHADKLPSSQACENNKDPIFDVLQQELDEYHHVLEIGSGTGQHSIYFAPRLPHLQWQTSDVISNHPIIKAWHDRHPAPNLHEPLAFDLTSDSFPNPFTAKTHSKDVAPYDAVFTANTLHIIAWPLVERLFDLVGKALPANGKLIIYGPFNDHGHYSSDSNEQFDQYLRQRNPNSGIRDKADIMAVAKQHHLALSNHYKMPANNEILVFKKNSVSI